MNGMTPRMERLAVVQRVARRHGTSAETLLGRSQARKLFEAWREAMREIKAHFGDSNGRIARLFDLRHPSTVWRAINGRPSAATGANQSS
ncbi:MAG: hypothetical protein SNJ79_11665 [Sphingomonadaceae bacterium]